MISILAFLHAMNLHGRPWDKEETLWYHNKNNRMLEELNKTLTRRDRKDSTGKIGIFAQGQAGDLATAMSVLQYADILWPNKDIVWFANFPNADLLRYAPISEVRMWPWAGNGLPVGTPDFYPLLSNDNRLNLELASQYELTKDLEDGFFPVPWQVATDKQDGVEYPNVSKMIFDVPMDWKWHPLLSWSHEEIRVAKSFMDKLPKGRKNILLETFCGSGQSNYWDVELTKRIMQHCEIVLGKCNFIFASHKHKGGQDNCGLDNEILCDGDGRVSAAHFTVRQAALLINYCDLMVCMSSGISVATSAWNLCSVPKLQYCGSKKCSTVAIANGPIELITTDFKLKPEADVEFFNKLNEMLLKL